MQSGMCCLALLLPRSLCPEHGASILAHLHTGSLGAVSIPEVCLVFGSICGRGLSDTSADEVTQMLCRKC